MSQRLRLNILGRHIFTHGGKPCPKGHAKRYKSNSKCVTCHLDHKKATADDIRAYRESRYLEDFCVRSFTRVYGAGNHYAVHIMEDMLGYTMADLRWHVSLLLEDGMTWADRSAWHIDHIESIKKFKDDGFTDIRQINALGNLMPRWAKDNLKKGG